MKDLYSFDATIEDAVKTYAEIRESYNKILSRIGLPFVTARAATGNMGGSESHEYHFLSDAGEDTLLTCEACHQTTNIELGEACPTCQSSSLTRQRAIEIGHTFLLGTRYSVPLHASSFVPDSPYRQPIQMGCYGLGVTRIFAAAAELCRDGKGLAWPKALAPYQIFVVPVSSDTEEAAERTYDRLNELWPGEVLLDDRISTSSSNLGFGARMTDAELIGFSWIIVLGRNFLEGGNLEIHDRKSGQKRSLSEESALDYFRQAVSTSTTTTPAPEQ